MHKKFSGNIIKVHMLLFMICVAVNISLHGMDVNDDLVMREIVVHNVGHDAHRKLAVLNTAYNKIIEEHYRPDKKCIEKYIQEKEAETLISMTGTRSWNKNFNTCAWVTYDVDCIGLKDLQLTLVGIVNNKVVVTSALWKDFVFPIFDGNIRPFFDKEERACFYGFGRTLTCHGNFFTSAQYCIDCNGNSQCYCCFLECNSGWSVQVLNILLQYPVLVKAFLQSKLVQADYGCSHPHHCDGSNYYHLNGVTLPDDYKTFKKSMRWEQVERMLLHVRDYSNFTSYDSLPDEVRKAIDYHYEEQQRGKNSQTSQEK